MQNKQKLPNPSPMMSTVAEMVFCYQNCSELLREKIVLLIEKIFEIGG